MDMKKEVFKFLNKNPNATTPELRNAFPDGHKKTLWNYWGQWKKENGIAPKDRKNSIRQKVFDYYNKNPHATPEELRKAFPEANSISISNYRYQWKKQQPEDSEIKQKRSIKQIVYGFLNEHPYSTFSELCESLPHIKPSSISGYHSTWKKKQAPKDYYERKKELSQIRKEQRAIKKNNIYKYSKTYPTWSEHEKELIQALKDTIEAQKGTIEVMKYQNKILKAQNPTIDSEISNISPKELDDLKNIISVFIKGLRK